MSKYQDSTSFVKNRLVKYILFFLIFIFLILFVACGGAKKTETKYLGTKANIESNLAKYGEVILKNEIIDLNGDTINIKGTLIFEENTKIINGVLNGVSGTFKASPTKCFENIKITGHWKNDLVYMEWFTEGEDPVLNYTSLCNLIELEGTIFLRKKYPLSGSVYSPYNTSKTIKIKGENSKTCGFILNTSHKKNGGYFKSEKGSNIHLENILIQTIDFDEGVSNNKDFIFASCILFDGYEKSNPSMDYFRLINCLINGRVSFIYKGNTDILSKEEFLKTGIKEIEVKDCQLNEVCSILTLKRSPYEKVEILNNTINSISGAVFFFPIGASGYDKPLDLYDARKNMVLKNNVVINETVISDITSTYVALVVAKGGNFLVEGNKIENIITKNPGGETYPFYCSASNKLTVKDNITKNCFNVDGDSRRKKRGQNTLLKLKGAANAEIIDNVFELEKSALVKAGLISNKNISLSEVDATLFRFNLWSASGKNKPNKNIYAFRGNHFKTAYLNDYSVVARNDFIFENNTIKIDYIAEMPKDRWGDVGHYMNHTLVYMRGKDNNHGIIFSNNTIEIKSMESGQLKIIDNPFSHKEYELIKINENRINSPGKASFYTPKSTILEKKENKINY
jgi:hypothetical protein